MNEEKFYCTTLQRMKLITACLICDAKKLCKLLSKESSGVNLPKNINAVEILELGKIEGNTMDKIALDKDCSVATLYKALRVHREREAKRQREAGFSMNGAYEVSQGG